MKVECECASGIPDDGGICTRDSGVALSFIQDDQPSFFALVSQSRGLSVPTPGQSWSPHLQQSLWS